MMGRFLRTGFCMVETCQQFTQLQPRKRLGDTTLLFSSLLYSADGAQNASRVHLRKTSNSVFNTCHRLSHDFWNATVKGTVNVSHRLTQGDVCQLFASGSPARCSFSRYSPQCESQTHPRHVRREVQPSNAESPM